MNSNQPKTQKTSAGNRTVTGRGSSKEYEVEAIVSEQIRNSKVHYLVKWKGYSKLTWEPYENLSNCQMLIEKFKEENRRAKLNSPMELVPAIIRRSTETATTGEQYEAVGGLDEGFARGLEPEQILGASDSAGELAFLMKWKGSNIPDMVPARVANVKCANVVIDFYERSIVFNPKHPETTAAADYTG